MLRADGSDPRDRTLVAPSIVNAGVVAGALNIQGTVDNSGVIQRIGTIDGRVNNSGRIEGGSITESVTNTGVLHGFFEIKGDLINKGLVEPGAPPSGLVLVYGNFVQTAEGVLEIEVDGSSPGSSYSLLQALGSISLDGSLRVNLGVAPEQGITAITNYGQGEIDGTFTNLPEGATFTAVGGKKFTISYAGGSGNDVVFRPVDNASVVVNRQVFYNNSMFDGDIPGANAADDGAMATDKTALLPGEAASSANITSYSKGINGVIVDVDGLPSGTLSTSDFVLKVGVGTDPALWSDAPAPVSIRVRRGSGIRGSDRVTLIWSDGAIKNEFLQVELQTTSATALPDPDVFYFGNLIGDTSNGDGAPAVNASDLVRTRNAIGTGPVTIQSATDFNRDGKIDALDLVIVRNNIGRSLIALGANTFTIRPLIGPKRNHLSGIQLLESE